MGRLIDADKIIHMDYDEAINYILTAKADYDVDSVIEQLRDITDNYYTENATIDYKRAIEIVKEGGKNE